MVYAWSQAGSGSDQDVVRDSRASTHGRVDETANLASDDALWARYFSVPPADLDPDLYILPKLIIIRT